MEAAVNRLSCLHAAGGFFPDIYDQEVTVGGIVQFVRMFGDEEFLEMTRLGGDDYRQRTATWRKGRAVRLYHRPFSGFLSIRPISLAPLPFPLTLGLDRQFVAIWPFFPQL